MTETTHEFQLHPAIAYSLIRDQGNSLTKAVMESVMNSLDSRSTTIDVTIEADRIVIADDGEGFADMREIDEWFSTIGTPHKRGTGTIGEFGIGRLQLLAHGSSIWHSNAYRMTVDVKTRGLEHDVELVAEHTRGCRIELKPYERLDREGILQLAAAIRDAIQWADCVIKVNGIRATRDKKDEKWTVVTEDAYVRISRQSQLGIHNCGIHVKNEWRQRIGVGGIVISRKPLMLNAARNDIDDQCPVWRGIAATLKEYRPAGSRTPAEQTRLFFRDEQDQAAYARRIATGEVTLGEALRCRAPVIAAAANRFMALHEIGRPGSGKIVVVPSATPEGQVLMRSELAMVMLERTLAPFSCRDGEELRRTLLALATEQDPQNKDRTVQNFITALAEITFAKWSDFEDVFKSNYAPVPASALTGTEKAQLEIANTMSNACAEALGLEPRPVGAGNSTTRTAWTDGEAIWIARDRLAGKAADDMARLAVDIAIQYASQSLNTQSIEPPPEDATRILEILEDSEAVGMALRAGLTNLEQRAATEGRRSIGPAKTLIDFDEACEEAFKVGDDQ
jgi:hypothetical protein